MLVTWTVREQNHLQISNDVATPRKKRVQRPKDRGTVYVSSGHEDEGPNPRVLIVDH